MLYHILGALAWNGDVLSSGSRDRLILQRDARTPNAVERRLIGHRQEVSPPPPPSPTPQKNKPPSPLSPPKKKQTNFCHIPFNFWSNTLSLMVTIEVNPVSPTSDLDRISPYSFSTVSSRQVMRIKKNINKGIIGWSNSKFSKLTSYELYSRQ